MSTEVTYTMVMNVSSSWDMLKRQKDYENVAGELIFKKLFQLAPEAKLLFGFSSEGDLKTDPKFGMHSRTMVDMIDCAVAFLGPDLDPLTEHFEDLGRRHVSYGVRPEYLSTMGRAVIYALEEILGAKFTLEDVKDWTAVFQLMISKMVQGMKV